MRRLLSHSRAALSAPLPSGERFLRVMMLAMLLGLAVGLLVGVRLILA